MLLAIRGQLLSLANLSAIEDQMRKITASMRKQTGLAAKVSKGHLVGLDVGISRVVDAIEETGCSDLSAGRLAVVEREKQKIQLDISCVAMDSANVNMASISAGIKRVFVDPENALYGDMQRTRKILKTCSARSASRKMLAVCALNTTTPPRNC